MGFKDIVEPFIFIAAPEHREPIVNALVATLEGECSRREQAAILRASDPYRDDPEIGGITAVWDKYGEGVTVVAILRRAVDQAEAEEILGPHGARYERCHHEHDCCGCLSTSGPSPLDADENGMATIWTWTGTRNL
jgi:hypothetical protein